MAIDLSNPVNSSKLLAVVDMGTNSFKMLVVRAEPNGKFLAVDRIKEPVVLGSGMLADDATISPDAQHRAIVALRKFDQVLQSQRIHYTKIVATSAVREAANRLEFLSRIREEVGFEVDVLSGEEEARLVYLGVLQFLPVYDATVLTVDIGGGSTEFVIGKQGKVLFATSLKLGHVTLTEAFVKDGKLVDMRNHIRSVLQESGLIEKVREIGFEIAVGSSGTVRSIENAIFRGYGRGLTNNIAPLAEFGRDWRFSREELGVVAESLCCLDTGGIDAARRAGFFKRRSEFITAGAVLLSEIFETLDIDEMRVSGSALGEGIVSEILATSCDDYDINVNSRWRSVVHLSTRFNSPKKMKSAVYCASIAREFFEGVRKCDVLTNHENKCAFFLDEKDLEYLEAACLLHSIGIFIGKKRYHKQSYHIIKNSNHLHGYSAEEVELIALLARYHRKKFPSYDQPSLQHFENDINQKFRLLCAIIRISVAIQQCQWMTFEGLELSPSDKGFKVVLKQVTDQPLLTDSRHQTVKDIEDELRPELENFKEVFQQKLLFVAPST
ncbi:exopolyphosphatase [Macadamia integrifolia]|uniref:exopolyphosphatase n=1 Tax=Macadamia integrifolia TaxID=60698 RepID=UPI001C4EF079|nr:exopolyphosphatase [Macadamia integrifolia]